MTKAHVMQTYTGRQFDPLGISEGNVAIEDIAHALALTNRYGGHTRYPYSVAQHSLWVARTLPLELQLWGLLHDAAEAYLGDVISPIKHQLLPFVAIEERAMQVIAAKFGLPWREPVAVRLADLAVGAAECRFFGIAVNAGREQEPAELASMHCQERNWRDVEQQFLTTFIQLKKAMRRVGK